MQPAEIDETLRAGEMPREYAERLARKKALTVSRERPHEWVLGADTIVVVNNAILGKPVDGADAVRMLRLLSGRKHAVITGVCLVEAGARGKGPEVSEDIPYAGSPSRLYHILRTENRELRTGAETTLVTMNELSDEEIREYVATGEPMDKAGAYAIQGMASRWIPRIEGDYSNVVGLPVALVYRMLQGVGGI